MSHTVSIQTQCKDADVIARTCAAMGLEAPGQGTATIFSGVFEGTTVKLKGWAYPIIITKDGAIKYDNYGGNWGAQAELDRFLKLYGVEAVKKQMRRMGRALVSQKELPNGEVKLVFAG